jgi:hypothetical protein
MNFLNTIAVSGFALVLTFTAMGEGKDKQARQYFRLLSGNS